MREGHNLYITALRRALELVTGENIQTLNQNARALEHLCCSWGNVYDYSADMVEDY